MITQGDLDSVRYFWKEFSDIERWALWRKKLPELTAEYPLLVKAWNEYLMARQLLDIVVDHLEDTKVEV